MSIKERIQEMEIHHAEKKLEHRLEHDIKNEIESDEKFMKRAKKQV